MKISPFLNWALLAILTTCSLVAAEEKDEEKEERTTEGGRKFLTDVQEDRLNDYAPGAMESAKDKKKRHRES